MNPFLDHPVEKWDQVTDCLINEFSFELKEIVYIVTCAWD